VEAFPTWTEKAQVAKCLLKEIISWFRIPVVYWVRQWAGLCGWCDTVDGQGIRNNLEAAHGRSPPEFRESRMYEQDSKIPIGKTMPGDPPTVGSVTAHSLAQE
jgi:hypothetical protein